VHEFRGKVAAITGAGSGIGRALAVEMAGRGGHVALSDVDVAGLADTATLVEQATGVAGRAGVKVSTAVVDVTGRDAVERWAAEFADEFAEHDEAIDAAARISPRASQWALAKLVARSNAAIV
jgi:NAD(P)-dependent dehydrogenase (short-subunit alcohol dehydrogenase family)